MQREPHATTRARSPRTSAPQAPQAQDLAVMDVLEEDVEPLELDGSGRPPWATLEVVLLLDEPIAAEVYDLSERPHAAVIDRSHRS